MLINFLPIEQQDRRFKTFEFLGKDSLSEAKDKDYFLNYTTPISYEFNSHGFREEEFPNFKNKNVVIGSSFSNGIGQPKDERWPCYLEKLIGERIYIVASDGASNFWMTKVLDYIVSCQPKSIFAMFGFNFYDTSFKDDKVFYEWPRRQVAKLEHSQRSFLKDQFDYALKKFKQYDSKKIPVLCSANPYFDDLYKCDEYYNELITYDRFFNHDFEKLKKIGDLARDGVHFGSQTSQEIAENFYKKYSLHSSTG